MPFPMTVHPDSTSLSATPMYASSAVPPLTMSVYPTMTIQSSAPQQQRLEVSLATSRTKNKRHDLAPSQVHQEDEDTTAWYFSSAQNTEEHRPLMRPCPQCGIMIKKTFVCNKMECLCGRSICLLQVR